ncbi:MAG: GTPase HflX [Thermoplasmata archaeon]|nr:GTPase HflX [Thermoplasmata archaeon]
MTAYEAPGPDDTRRCVVVSIREDIDEINALVESLRFELLGTVIQRRDRPDPRTYVGRGKAEEVRNTVEELGADLVIVDDELKPSQVHNLQSTVAIEVFDRIRLILEIFTRKARSQEAKLQVELATLRHRIPLVKETINLLKKGERPGLLAGGEVGTHQYLREIRQRMAKIKRELDDVKRVRSVRRKHRRRRSFVTVSVAGYTNAGKTSALNMLTEAGAEVDSRYFSTLSPLSRTVEGVESRVLINDTVGFIEDLPPWLIEAFESTLEEVYDADLVILVIDASEALEMVERKMRTSLEIIKRDEDIPPILFLLNKVDLIYPSELRSKVSSLQDSGMLVGPWIPVQLNVTRPKRREAMRRSIFHTILRNLEDIQLVAIEMDEGMDLYSIEVRMDEDTRNLMGIVREKAIYIDLSHREEGMLTFAMERNYLEKIKEYIVSIDGIRIELVDD